ncbi:MAG: diaminopimelate decarboxylase [Alphaproteobacteria bacterium]|nr:diaminopimelate decarboxylase [Alphaproteobacteria bacterium]
MDFGKVKVNDIVAKTGTPVFVYSYEELTKKFNEFNDATKLLKQNTTVCFAVKSNSNPNIVKILSNLGAGADIVSGGELDLALYCGVDPSKIVFSGVGKSCEEIKKAIDVGIKQLNAESEEELETIYKISKEMGKKSNVGIRINPNVDAHTHAKITTGKSENKFGIDWDLARELFTKYKNNDFINLHGIEIHVGSQILDEAPFKETFLKVKKMLDFLKEDGVNINTIDLGGGLGVVYEPNQKPLPPKRYVEILKECLGDFSGEFVFEPGRYISATCGVLVGKIIRIKKTKSKQFAIIDAGMNDLIRPALYDAYHPIDKIEPNGNEKNVVYDVVGPICESSDSFATNREILELSEGDYLGIGNAGAYGAVMSSTYNGHPLCAEVMIKDEKFEIIRNRQTIKDLLEIYPVVSLS